MNEKSLILAHDLLMAHPEVLAETPPAPLTGAKRVIARHTVDLLSDLATHSDSQIIRARAGKALTAIAHAPAEIQLSALTWSGITGHPEYVVVTHQPALLALARFHGVATLELALPDAGNYSGIRHLLVPGSLVEEFADTGTLPEERLQEFFPLWRALSPNEYVVFYLAIAGEDPTELADTDDRVQFCHLGREDYLRHIARHNPVTRCVEKLRHLDIHDISIPTGNPALAAYYDALNDPDIDSIVVTGPAGSGKTYTAINYAHGACIAGQYIHTVVLKEGKNPLGAVKGGVEEKMAPMVEFARDSLRSAEYHRDSIRKKRKDEAKFGQGDAEAGRGQGRGDHGSAVYDQVFGTADLKWKRNFTAVAYEQAQGRTFDGHVIILDEVQRTHLDQIDTLLTRPGTDSKLIVAGDMAQYTGGDRARHYSGLPYAVRLLYGSERTAFIRLNIVLRSHTAATVVRNRAAVRAELGLPL